MRTAGRAAIPLVLLLLVAAGFAPAADAKLKAKTSVTTKAGASRLVVKLSSTKRLTAATKPRKVSVKAGRSVYRLKRSGTAWRSKAYRGDAAAKLLALDDDRVTVRVKTRSGTRSLRSKVSAPDQTLFAPPGRELNGQEAYNNFQRYLVNSRFTDCPAGWPNCAVEEQYNHCAGGSGWEYHRYTPTSGADINSYGSYQVTGAQQHADGSWAVEYVVDAYGSQSFYHWEVATDGTVRGTYWAPGNAPPDPPDQQLGPLRWQQPAGCA